MPKKQNKTKLFSKYKKKKNCTIYIELNISEVDVYKEFVMADNIAQNCDNESILVTNFWWAKHIQVSTKYIFKNEWFYTTHYVYSLIKWKNVPYLNM